jgi:hypothetical protein|tara:strand:+ start:357 stop:530 length:174 start_codon:yes stop_codon:yes gene_type:complete
MTFYETLFITSLVSVVAFVAWRVYIIETLHLKGITETIAEIKTDIKWLVTFHNNEKK